SLGGIARTPHPPQRMPVSRPARASSKKCLRLTTPSVTTEETHEHGGGVAAERVDETHAAALDLPPPGFAANLGGDLGDLGRPGGADRMSLGLEPAGGIDREL